VSTVGEREPSEVVLRRLARDQWVRVHGTPRISVLVGGAHGAAVWRAWLAAGALDGVLIEDPLEAAVPAATARAMAAPAVPIAIACTREALAAWRAGRRDRLAAMVEEGVIEIPDLASEPASAPETVKRERGPLFEARSAAELALFEALEATPATMGRFERNGYLAVHFGGRAAEIDLLSRKDRIAIEVDGFYHFTDLDAYRRDRKKDLLLQTHGWLVIRVLAQDVMQDARAAVTAVCQAMASRKKDSP
jgi:very-short-patch-repair endonuclease